MNTFLRRNLYSILLGLFIVTVAGSGMMFEFKLFGIDFYAFRILLILSLVYLFFTRKLKLFSNKPSRYTFFFLIIWLAYACVSVLWCIDKTAACKDIMYLLYGIATFVFLVSLKNAHAEFEDDFVKNWSLVFSVVLLFSVWEVYTGTHLSSNFTERLYELEPFHNLNFIPVFTFDNPNHYSIYVCLSAALFISYGLKNGKFAIMSFLLAFCLFLIHILSSRFGLIIFGFYGLIVSFYLYFNNKTGFKNIKILIGKFAFVLVFILAGVFFTNKTENVYQQKLKEIVVPKDDRLPSNVIRRNLVLNGYDFLKESNGLGVGAGNYMTFIDLGKGKQPTDGVNSPHSWIIEIFTQYGLIIGLLFLLWGIYILKVIYSSIKKNGFSRAHLQLLLLFFCYAIMSNSNSIFMPLPLNWLMFALIVIYTDELLKTNQTAHV